MSEKTVKKPASPGKKKVLDAKEVNLKASTGKMVESDDRIEVGGIKLPELESNNLGDNFNREMFAQIPITVNVELGHTNMTLQDVLGLKEGAIIELDRLAGEPLDLVVKGQLIARGEVVAVDDNYGLRITEVLSKKQ